MAVEIPNLVLIFNIIANYLTLLINMIIIIDVNRVEQRLYMNLLPTFYDNYFKNISYKIRIICISFLFLPYIKMIDVKFNLGLQTNHFSIDITSYWRSYIR